MTQPKNKKFFSLSMATVLSAVAVFAVLSGLH